VAAAGLGQPWAALAPLGPSGEARALRGKINPGREPALTVLLLARLSEAEWGPAEAGALLRRAVTARPNEVVLLDGLARLLMRQGRPAEAVEFYRGARAVRPQLGVGLAQALREAGRSAEGEGVLRELVDRSPDNPEMRFHLGLALHEQKKHAEAEAAFRKAIDLKHDYPDAHYNLGNALQAQKKHAEAEGAFRQAIDLKRDDPEAHNNLGTALGQQKKYAEAEAACRQAIALKHDYAAAHTNLGTALLGLKKLDEAVTAYRKADQLLPNDPVIRANLRRTEQWLRLDRKLTACLAGKDRPASPQEALDLANFCGYYRERPRTALRFCLEAFKEAPKLADNLKEQPRYHAACFAALAAAGKGQDAAKLPEAERAELRQKALGWLRADLKAHAALLESRKELRSGAHQRLGVWLRDADLASVREPTALAALPEAERASWRALWADVVALRKRAEGGS
jgi:Flp pilus assembly protein TadD